MSGNSAIEDALIPVDALGRKWAAWGRDRTSHRLHPLEAMRLMHDGAVLGGGPTGMPEDVKVWDIIIEGDGELLVFDHTKLLKLWYTRAVPASVLADRLGISRPTLYKNWNTALHSMRTALKAKGLRL